MLLCLVVAPVAMAQSSGGSSGGGMPVSDRVDAIYSASYKDSPEMGRADWMSYVILWRGQPQWRSARRIDDVAGKEGERLYREASAAATLAGRSIMGSYTGTAAYWAEFDRDRNSLVVLGTQYHVPVRDSTLVILVDRADGVGGAPYLVGTAIIDGRMSSPSTAKSWVSGDTLFTIRSKSTGIDDFLAASKKDPAIAAFLQ